MPSFHRIHLQGPRKGRECHSSSGSWRTRCVSWPFFCQSIVTQQNILKFATRFISRFLSEKFIRLQFIQMILVMSSILWIASGNFILSLIQGLVNASPCSASRILIYRSLQSIPLYFQCQRSGCCLESEEWNFCVPRPAAWLHRRDLVQDDRWDASALCWHPWGWSCDAWLHAWPNHFDSNSTRILQFQGNACAASLSARIICRTQEERGAQYCLSAGWDGIICPSAPDEKGPWAKVIICKHAAHWQFNLFVLGLMSLVYHQLN